MKPPKKSNGNKKRKKPGLFVRVRHWWKQGTKRKGDYVEHKEDFVRGHVPNSDVGATFSVEEDLESCCQGLLAKGSPHRFDKSPLLLIEEQSVSSCASGTLFVNEPVPNDKEEIPDSNITNQSTPILSREESVPSDVGSTNATMFDRRTTQDSNQVSLESLDSLAWSCLEEEESFATPRMANIGDPPSGDPLGEHVHFLRVQTQPRRVELVWKDQEPPVE